jgi:ABC-type transport system involved in multi-copper enzyme maturation permease subunit
MKVLIRKEIRLLLPAWIVAVLLAMVQGITRPYDFYIASLLFFGLTIMSLSTIGRETSLNTFSSVLAQPAERIRIWQVKLSVLAAAFLTVFFVWLVAFCIAFINSNVDVSDRENSYNLFITVCLIATATFTGGLWTTLLLRQLAAAFWLTLLVPAVLSGLSGVFLVNSESDSLVIAVLSVVIGIYSIAGFFFARRLYFHAQDVGWSGGVITLPEWKLFSARPATSEEVRERKPIFALLKKELLLQQGVLTGAIGVLVLHAGIIGLRAVHHFQKDSAGDELTSIIWMAWLVLPALLGSIAVAEERKIGVVESQFCQPVSRRVQFTIKFLVTLFLGIFLGGVMPMLLEKIGLAIGTQNSMFATEGHPTGILPIAFLIGCIATATWLTLVSFFASSVAKNFLQAIGIALVTFVLFMLCIPAIANLRTFFTGSVDGPFLLPLIIAIPTIPIALAWLAYRNYAHFREGWPLWRRNLLGLAGAILFIFISSNAIYGRAWEAFMPAEPAHGPAKLSLANPPELRNETYANLLVRLPEGRVWFDYLSNRFPWNEGLHWSNFWLFFNPLPRSAGPQKFIAGNNWLDASARHVDETVEGAGGARDTVHITGYADTVGIQRDGTLWASDQINQTSWEPDKLVRVGDETNWQQLVRGHNITSVLLLKNDGTLWRWGTNHFNFGEWPEKWPGLKAFTPYQIGTDSDWTGIWCLRGSYLARKVDGTVWRIGWPQKDGTGEVVKLNSSDLNHIVTENFSKGGFGEGTAYVRRDGTLWYYGDLRGPGPNNTRFVNMQCSHDTNWVAVANTWDWMVAIKNDGTLWQWLPKEVRYFTPSEDLTALPTRLGIHNDWISLTVVEGGIVSLAADGSLWFWPNPNFYNYSALLTRLPKQPQFLGNIYNAVN